MGEDYPSYFTALCHASMTVVISPIRGGQAGLASLVKKVLSCLDHIRVLARNAFESERVFDDCPIDRSDIIRSEGYQTRNEHYRGMKL